MAAITWRNIEAPDLRGAGALFNQAAVGTTAMGNALTNAMATYKQEQQRATDFRKNENTNKFLNSLYSQFTTPEALQQAISSGAIGQQLAGFGNEIDHAQVRGAAEKLLGERQQRALTSMDFQNKSIENADAPLLAQIQANSLSKDPLVRASAVEQMAQLNARNQGKAAQYIFDNEGKIVTQEREGIKFGWEKDNQGRLVEKHKSDLETAAVNRQTNMMNAQSNRMSAAASANAANLRAALTKREIANLDKSDNAADYLKNAAVGYRKAQTEASDRLFKTATDLKMDIPLDAAGRPDWSKLTEGELNQLNAHAGAKTVDLAARSNTMMGDATYNALVEKFGVKAANAAAPDITKLFNTGPVASMGVEAARAANAIKAEERVLTRLNEEHGGYSTKNMEGDIRKEVMDNLKAAGLKGEDVLKFTNQAMNHYKAIKGSGENPISYFPDSNAMVRLALRNAAEPFTTTGSIARDVLGNPEEIKAKLKQRESSTAKRNLQDAAGRTR